MKNKPSDVDKKFDKTSGEGGERMSVSVLSTNGEGGIIFVSVCKLDNEVKSMRWSSRNVRVG